MPGELKIQIPAPNIKLMKVKIKGITPLIYNKWSEKAKQMIKDKQAKKANKGREVRNPEKEYEESFYYDKDGKIAFPALNIKQCIVSAARLIEGVTMVVLRSSVFVVGDMDGYIPVTYKDKSMREDMVRVGMGSADIRYRGQLTDWSMEFVIKLNADVLSPEQVLNLLQIAGFSCGIGEWRPERNGDFGTFEIETEEKAV